MYSSYGTRKDGKTQDQPITARQPLPCIIGNQAYLNQNVIQKFGEQQTLNRLQSVEKGNIYKHESSDINENMQKLYINAELLQYARRLFCTVIQKWDWQMGNGQDEEVEKLVSLIRSINPVALAQITKSDNPNDRVQYLQMAAVIADTMGVANCGEFAALAFTLLLQNTTGQFVHRCRLNNIPSLHTTATIDLDNKSTNPDPRYILSLLLDPSNETQFRPLKNYMDGNPPALASYNPQEVTFTLAESLYEYDMVLDDMKLVIRSPESLVNATPDTLNNAIFFSEGNENGVSWEKFSNGENPHNKRYEPNQLSYCGIHIHQYYNIDFQELHFDHAFAVTAPNLLADKNEPLSSYNGIVIDAWANSTCSLSEYLSDRKNPYGRRIDRQAVMVMAVEQCGTNMLAVPVGQALRDKAAEVKEAVLPEITERSQNPLIVNLYLRSGRFYNLPD